MKTEGENMMRTETGNKNTKQQNRQTETIFTEITA